MKRLVVYAIISAALLTTAAAQNLVLKQEAPMLSQTLAGSVAKVPGRTVPGALVEEMGKDWSGIESVTTTDSHGRFELPEQVPGTTHYVRVSLDSGERLLVKVELRKDAPEDLRLSFLPKY